MAIYTIKKDERYSSGYKLNGLRFWKKKLRFSAKFDDSCFYDPQILPASDRLDINKLYGMSDAFSDKTALVGWRCASATVIELVTYCHLNGAFVANSEKHLGYIIKGEEETVFCEIEVKPNGYAFSFTDGAESSNQFIPFITRHSFASTINYFYHGGSIPAPQNMSVEITEY